MKKKFRDEIYRLYADLCQALSDPKRILILYELGEGRKSVSELTEALGLRQANISQHLMLLRERGLVSAERDGTAVYYTLVNPKILQALDLMREVLAEKLAKTTELSAMFEAAFKD